MSEKIKVAICDDVKFLCDGFCEQFAQFSDLEPVGAAYSAADCPDLLREKSPDVLLLDIRMETKTAGLDILPEIKHSFPSVKIIMLTSFIDDEYIFAAFANGADDYCDKTTSVDKIAETIKKVYDNDASLRPEIAQKLVQRTQQVQRNQLSLLYLYNRISQLSTGEYELLREMYYGSSYKNIAAEKFIEIDSVRKMAKRVLRKMSASTMKELVEQLRELRFFEFIDRME